MPGLVRLYGGEGRRSKPSPIRDGASSIPTSPSIELLLEGTIMLLPHRRRDLVGAIQGRCNRHFCVPATGMLLNRSTRFPQEGRIAVMRSNTAVRPAASGGETSGPTKMLLRALNDTAGTSIIRPHPYRDVSKSVRTQGRITSFPLLRGHLVGLESLTSAMRRELLPVMHDRRWQSYVVYRHTAIRSPMPG
jgi:hypothetical protein